MISHFISHRAALQALQESTDRLPEKLSADNGNWSGDNLQALEQSGTDAYIASDKGEKTRTILLDSSERKLVKADFDYHEADNTFSCPEVQVLTMKRESQVLTIKAPRKSVPIAYCKAGAVNQTKG